MSVRLPLAWASLVVLGGCGATTSPAESPRPEAPESASLSPSEGPAEEGKSQVPANAAIAVPAAPESTETPAAEAPPDSPKKAGHDVVYRVSPDGIVVLALGAKFEPSAKVKRVQGGYMVYVSVEVEAEKPIQLLSGSKGPLSLSARIRRPKEEFHHDERGESKVVSLAAGETKTFERAFPSLPVKPLARSQEAELRFGLWGLGEGEEDRLPVNKFFTVLVTVDQQGAHAKVDVPAGTASED